ncbi:MAG: hypothetical protein OSW77_14400 [Proteobacteria bacterium]|nr:hypothetical protein [Pseudomonadota bacterium]
MKIATLCTRRLVPDADGRLVGLLSLDDLLRGRADGLAGVILAGMARELGEAPPLPPRPMRIAAMGTAGRGLPR